MQKFNFFSDLKFLCQNWSEIKNLDFFGLKIKYAIWIVPIPIVGWIILFCLMICQTLGLL